MNTITEINMNNKLEAVDEQYFKHVRRVKFYNLFGSFFKDRLNYHKKEADKWGALFWDIVKNNRKKTNAAQYRKR